MSVDSTVMISHTEGANLCRCMLTYRSAYKWRVRFNLWNTEHLVMRVLSCACPHGNLWQSVGIEYERRRFKFCWAGLFITEIYREPDSKCYVSKFFQTVLWCLAFLFLCISRCHIREMNVTWKRKKRKQLTFTVSNGTCLDKKKIRTTFNVSPVRNNENEVIQ